MEAMHIVPNHSNADNIVSFPQPVKLKLDGTPKIICQNKLKGRKSEVYAFEVEDLKKILAYFRDLKMWNHYLLLILGLNMARRIGDTLSLRWENFYNPKSGTIRDHILEIREDKTDKLANPRINSACKDAIALYIHETGCNPSENAYKNPVFMQISGTHRGAVLSDDGHRKALKKAAEAVGITYNVGTHSARKTFGMISRMLHPGDYDSMELLQTIYNHSDTKTTKNYIGLTKKKVDRYYDDIGDFCGDYIMGDKQYQGNINSPILHIASSDLRDIIRLAYKSGMDNCGRQDDMVHVDAMSNLIGMIEQLSK